MTNIIGGNAGKIQHFDQGSDGLVTNGTNKSKTADFFQLVSLLSASPVGLEKPSELNNLISSQDADHFPLNDMFGVAENFEPSLSRSEGRNINSSTFSQLSGIIKSTGISSEGDNELDLESLLNTIRLELDKLQLGNDFLAIKNSKIGLKDATSAFLSLLEENSSNRAGMSKILDYLEVITASENLPSFALSSTSHDKTIGSAQLIKNLPFESGRNGSLLLDLPALDVTGLEKNEEIVLSSSLYLDQNSLVDKNIKNQNKKTDVFNLTIELSNSGLNTEVSNLKYGNSTLQKEKFPLTSLDELSVISVDVPNKNLAALNVSVTLENSESLIIPEAYVIINFDGSQDSARPLQQWIDLTRIKSAPSREGEQHANKISQIMAGIGLETNDLVIDETQTIKSFQLQRGYNSLTEKFRNFSSELVTNSEPSLINKIDLSEISSVNFAKVLKDQLQFAVNAVTKKLNFKKDIAEFLETSKAALIIGEAASKVVKKEVGLNENTSVKRKLFLSSADAIGYRQAISSNGTKTDLITRKSMENLFTNSKQDVELALKPSDEQLAAIQNNRFATNFVGTHHSTSEQNFFRVEPTMDRSSIVQTQNFSQRISLLESQFSSRLANALLEQAINSNESFDLILEPESFGKVRVNVSVDSSQIDVKLTAENSSTLAILRSSESMLQTISEQNGLKLAEYNVELNNNAQNNEGSQGRKNEKDKNGNLNEGLEELENKQGSFVEDDDSHSLNLIA